MQPFSVPLIFSFFPVLIKQTINFHSLLKKKNMKNRVYLIVKFDWDVF